MDKAKNCSSFSDTSFMMSYHEQMKGNEKIQSRPESGRDTPFDLNHLKLALGDNIEFVKC